MDNPQEQQQPAGNDQLLQAIQQMLQQGQQPVDIAGQLLQQIQPEEIMAAFVQLGIPQEEAQQDIQQAMQGGQQSQGPGEEQVEGAASNPQEEQQEQVAPEGADPAQTQQVPADPMKAFGGPELSDIEKTFSSSAPQNVGSDTYVQDKQADFINTIKRNTLLSHMGANPLPPAPGRAYGGILPKAWDGNLGAFKSKDEAELAMHRHNADPANKDKQLVVADELAKWKEPAATSTAPAATNNPADAIYNKHVQLAQANGRQALSRTAFDEIRSKFNPAASNNPQIQQNMYQQQQMQNYLGAHPFARMFANSGRVPGQTVINGQNMPGSFNYADLFDPSKGGRGTSNGHDWQVEKVSYDRGLFGRKKRAHYEIQWDPKTQQNVQVPVVGAPNNNVPSSTGAPVATNGTPTPVIDAAANAAQSNVTAPKTPESGTPFSTAQQSIVANDPNVFAPETPAPTDALKYMQSQLTVPSTPVQQTTSVSTPTVPTKPEFDPEADKNAMAFQNKYPKFKPGQGGDETFQFWNQQQPQGTIQYSPEKAVKMEAMGLNPDVYGDHYHYEQNNPTTTKPSLLPANKSVVTTQTTPAKPAVNSAQTTKTTATSGPRVSGKDMWGRDIVSPEDQKAYAEESNKRYAIQQKEEAAAKVEKDKVAKADADKKAMYKQKWLNKKAAEKEASYQAARNSSYQFATGGDVSHEDLHNAIALISKAFGGSLQKAWNGLDTDTGLKPVVGLPPNPNSMVWGSGVPTTDTAGNAINVGVPADQQVKTYEIDPNQSEGVKSTVDIKLGKPKFKVDWDATADSGLRGMQLATKVGNMINNYNPVKDRVQFSASNSPHDQMSNQGYDQFGNFMGGTNTGAEIFNPTDSKYNMQNPVYSYGGKTFSLGGEYDLSPEEVAHLKSHGFNVEKL